MVNLCSSCRCCRGPPPRQLLAPTTCRARACLPLVEAKLGSGLDARQPQAPSLGRKGFKGLESFRVEAPLLGVG